MAVQIGVGSRTLSLRLASRTWDVREGCVFRIGRHPSNDVQLNDPRISRFHAEIVWQGGWPCLRDLGTVNGTVVDGHPFEGALLLEAGQKISIGRWVLTAELTEAPALVEDDEEEAFDVFGRPDDEDEVGGFSTQRDLHRLCLDMEIDERTGTLEIAAAKGATGAVTFCLGRVVAVSCGGLVGLQALERLLRSHSGSFRSGSAFELSDNTLDLSVRRYLREGFWAATRRHIRRRPSPPLPRRRAA